MRKLALITGGTSGIGFGVAAKLASTCDLALSYASDHEKAANAVTEIKGMAPNAKIMSYSKKLANYVDASELFELVQKDFGRAPDILVNSAGRISDGLFLTQDFASQSELVSEHLLVTMATCHLAVKDMYKKKQGRIINMSSISANFAKRGQAGYAAAKAGIEGFTRTLALEVAHRGITINAIAPGLIETPMTRGVLAKFEESGLPIGKRIPAGYAGTPQDVSGLVAFLCSDEGRYMTGSVFTVDGGRSLGDSSS